MAPTWKTLIVTLALCLAFFSNNIFARFLSVDPVDPRAYLQEPYPNPMGFNRYAYGNNNPYRYVDPDGRIPIVVPLVFIGKEIVGEVFEQTTGIPAPTLKNAGKFAGKQLLKTAKRYMVKPTGLAQNRSLRNLTHQEIQKTFSGSGFDLSGHAIKRLKDPRTRKLGFNTPNDVAKIFNKGEKFDAGNGEIGFSYKGLEAIVDPNTNRVVTLRPAKKRK